MAKEHYSAIQQYIVLVVCLRLFYMDSDICLGVCIFWAECELDHIKYISGQRGAPKHSPTNPSIPAFAILSKFNFFLCDKISQFKVDNISQ